jgi:hypothetical protein
MSQAQNIGDDRTSKGDGGKWRWELKKTNRQARQERQGEILATRSVSNRGRSQI